MEDLQKFGYLLWFLVSSIALLIGMAAMSREEHTKAAMYFALLAALRAGRTTGVSEQIKELEARMTDVAATCERVRP